MENSIRRSEMIYKGLHGMALGDVAHGMRRIWDRYQEMQCKLKEDGEKCCVRMKKR